MNFLILFGKALLGSEEMPRGIRYAAILLMLLAALVSAWLFASFSGAPHTFIYERF